MSSLSAEQKKRIEENKKRALEKRSGKGLSTVKPALTVPTQSYQGSSSSSYKHLSEKSNHGPPIQKTYNSNQGLSASYRGPSTSTISNQGFSASYKGPSTSNFQSKAIGGKSTSSIISHVGRPLSNNSYNSSSNKPSHPSGKNIPSNINVGTFYGVSGQILLKGKCVLLTKERFKVDIGYHAQLIETFKSLKTKEYDQNSKSWSFLLDEYSQLMSKVSQLEPEVMIERLHPCIPSLLSSLTKHQPQEEPDLSSVDEILVETLMPFQRVGVNTAIQRNGRILIADDMGLGKTLQAICIAAYYRKDWPLLIVSPSSVRYQWAQQVIKWLPSLPAGEINVVDSGKSDPTSGLVNIISYDLLSKKQVALNRKNFQIIIMDESHFLKNGKTVRTKAALPMLNRAKRAILLSGTPALSRPIELYPQISAISPKLFNFHDFGLRYCEAKEMPWGWNYNGSSNMEELQIIMSELIMIRRQKKTVLSQLPSKTREVVMLDPSKVKHKKHLKSFMGDLSKTSLKGAERHTVLLEFFHETCSAKLNAVKDYVLDFIESDKKFLIFAHHQEMLDCIEDCITSKSSDTKYIRIDGRTSSEKRNCMCNKFQTDPEYKVAILSITACNAGLNLSAASTVLFAELFWNPGILVQAEDRVHRIGQLDSVIVQYLLAKGTADDEIWPMIHKKLDILSKAGLNKEVFTDADTRHAKEEEHDQPSILDMFSTLGDISRESSKTGSSDHQNKASATDKNSNQIKTPTKRKPQQAAITTFFVTPPKVKQQKTEDNVEPSEEKSNQKTSAPIEWSDDDDEAILMADDDFALCSL